MLKEIKRWLRDKKGIAKNMLAWLILAVIVLVVGFIVIMIMTGKAQGALNVIGDLFRFKKV